MNYNFTTLNVRGLRNDQKRKSTFTWLNRNNSHIIFLQEVYCNDNDIAKWEREWGGSFYTNHGTNHSRGILIGIKNNIDVKCEKVYNDNHGRLLCVRMNINNKCFYLWNIYAPNDISDRKMFLTNMTNAIQDNSSDGHVIIGGDFNTVLNPALDKIGGNIPNPACANIINSFLNDNEIIDIWRLKHGNEIRYTWKQTNPHICSTLDYWFIPAIMDVDTKSIEIVTFPRSDHLLAVQLCLSFDTNTRGNSYWKFNNEWLNNDEFSKCLLKMIDECTDIYGEILSHAEFWSLCKNKIRTFCIEFARNSKSNNKDKIADIEKKLQEAYVNVTNNTNDENLKCMYNKLKLEYEIVFSHYIKGLQIRSKAKWVEEGERSTKYFLTLEKCNNYRKAVTVLSDDNSTITDQDKMLEAEIRYFSTLYTK